MQITYQTITTKEASTHASDFLMKEGNFGGIVSQQEEQLIHSEPLASLTREHAQYWAALDENNSVVGVVGINENEIGTDGYYLDWFAVDPDYRSQGVGSKLLELAEEFVRQQNGRYITIDTGDNHKYERARAFYEKHNYKQVGHVPEYYHPKCGRIDYYKKL